MKCLYFTRLAIKLRKACFNEFTFFRVSKPKLLFADDHQDQNGLVDYKINSLDDDDDEESDSDDTKND